MIGYFINSLKSIFIAVFIIHLVFSGGVWSKRAAGDISEYEKAMSFPEYDIKESKLFPTDPDQDGCLEFNCRHLTYLPLGSGWEMILKQQYDDDSFAAEKERIEKLCKNSSICGENENFDLPAYASVWDYRNDFEYAIINDEDNTVSYVYLQELTPNKIRLNSEYVPKNYEILFDEYENGASSFSIYNER